MRRILAIGLLSAAATLVSIAPAHASGTVTPNPVEPGGAITFTTTNEAGVRCFEGQKGIRYNVRNTSTGVIISPAPLTFPPNLTSPFSQTTGAFSAPSTPGSYELVIESTPLFGSTTWSPEPNCNTTFVVANAGDVPVIHPGMAVGAVMAVGGTGALVLRRRRQRSAN
jgi:hypothetical protein